MSTASPPLPSGLAAARPLWPALREELRLHHGAPDANGQPTWTLQDPVRHRFLRLDWITYEVLRRWWLADAEAIAEQVNRETTLHLGPEDVAEVMSLALHEELVHPTKAPMAQTSPHSGLRAALTWLLHHYLFFRVPLVHPDAALTRMLPAMRGLGGKTFTHATWLALLAGLWGVLQQTEHLGAQWLDLLSWQGLALYGGTLIGVKVAHELGHALVAKAHGLRVPTMGVAFMVLWPVAYTDTTEAWRLAQSRARLQIAAAGVRTELTLAAWATLLWTLLPDGPARTAAFIVATMTWVSSLLINLSPFMRFDGYFLLCDALDQPNLHERSFALARWWLRRLLLGWQAEPPEPLTTAQRTWMLLFAGATLSYRLVLYLGIAWTVYHFGFKALGLFLFAVELGWFIVGPIAREIGHWWAGRAAWQGQLRVRWSAGVLLGLIAVGFIPWSGRNTAAALAQPARHLAVRLPSSATVVEMPIQVGQSVRAGTPLLRTDTPLLQRERDQAATHIRQLEQELAAAALQTDQQARWSSLQSALLAARDQAAVADQELARLQPTAPFDGVVVDMHPELRVGHTAPPPRDTLLHLVSPGHWRVVAYADEATARILRTGQWASVVLDAAPLQHRSATVRSVAPHPSSVVAETTLVRSLGGLIDAQQAANGVWTPREALYRVELDLAVPPGELAPRQWRGHAVFSGPALSTWDRLGALGLSAWVREAGF